MTGFRLSPKGRRFLLWTARLAFLAHLLQIIAVDHWHAHPSSIAGVEGTAAHVAHCHGGGDCSDGGGVAGPALPVAAMLPSERSSLTVSDAEGPRRPATAFTETPVQPPRAA